MLRGIFKGVVDSWVWYDQLFLFGGVFLIILGVLILVFKYIKLPPNILESPKSDSIAHSGIIDNIFDAQAHKCSHCGWGFRVNAFDKLATCPKCGNVDNKI